MAAARRPFREITSMGSPPRLIPRVADWATTMPPGTPKVELCTTARVVPSVGVAPIDASDRCVQAAWHLHGVAVLRGLELERLLGRKVRTELSSICTHLKMAAPILDRTCPASLICVDPMDACQLARGERWARFEEVVAMARGPVMKISLSMANVARGFRAPHPSSMSLPCSR